MTLYEEDKSKYQIIPGIMLKPEQIDGIDFALHKFNCILNLKAGTGKTNAALVAAYNILSKVNNTICFIICPKAANTAFKKELARVKWHYSIHTTEEKKYDDKGRFFIFNYSALDDMVNLLNNLVDRGFKVFAILDEIHTLSNFESGVTKKMKEVRMKFNCVIGLSATPLLNNIEGLYNIVDYVRPGYLGTWYQFRANWVITKKRTIRIKNRSRQIDEIVGYQNIDQLRELLKGIIITRGHEYPLHYFYRDCSFTKEEEKYYLTASKGILDRDVSDEEKQMSARLWDLQRIVDGSSEFMEEENLYSKMRLLLNTMKEIISRGEGVLIYTEIEDTYKTLGELIEKYRGYLGFSRLWYITGKIPYKDRVECEKHLKARDVVILTKAGSASINLQAVNNVIFYDLPFALGSYIQVVGRVARTDSQYSEQNIYMLEVKDTIDTYKRMLLQSNMTLIQEIFGKDSTMPYYGDVENDVMKKYRQYFKNVLLWCRNKGLD